MQPQYLPVTIIADGYLFRENLRHTGKSETWLNTQLAKNKAAPDEVLLLTVDREDNVVLIRKEDAR